MIYPAFFQNLPPLENSPDSFLITPFVTIAQLELKKQKKFTIKKEIPTVALFSFSRNFTDSVFLQLIPIEIDPVNSGVLGETAGENEEKIVKTSQSITQILLNTAVYIKKNSRKTFLDIMVIKNKITSQVNRFPLKINDRLSY